MKDFRLYYSDGSELEIHDRVLINDQQIAQVEAILFPETEEATQYSCEEGGFLLVFENGDAQVWPNTDEDILLISRSNK